MPPAINLAPEDSNLCGLTTGNFDPQDPYNPNNCNPLYCTIEGKSPYPGFATPGCTIPGVYINRTAIPGYAIAGYAIPGTIRTININPYFNINDTGYYHKTKSPQLYHY